MDAAPEPPPAAFTPEERRIAIAQSITATFMAGAGWLLRAGIEPLPEGTTAVEALFSPQLWNGLWRFAASYVLLAAAAGYAIGILGVVGWMLVSRKAAETRRTMLVVGPIVAATISVAIALAAA